MSETRVCYVCLEGDDARKGDVNRYKRPDSNDGGDYHLNCALQVGYDEWETVED